MAIQFGSGVVVITPNAGNLATNPTPIRLNVLQEASLDFKGELKKLFGQNQFSVATARGKIDVSLKMKVGSLSQSDMNQIYFGQTAVVGGSTYFSESHPPAASVVPTQGSGLTVTKDEGVINGTTGVSFVKVASAPAVGQYSFTPAVTGGTPTAASYTFNAAETATTVILNFLASLTTGSTLTVGSQLMGYAPVSQLLLTNNFRGAAETWVFNAVTLGNFTRPTKMDDFWISDIDASCDADASGVIATVYNS